MNTKTSILAILVVPAALVVLATEPDTDPVATAEDAEAQAAVVKNVENWIEKLEDPNLATRVKAALKLQKIGSPASDAIPALSKLVADKQQTVQERAAAIFALESIASAAANASEAIVALISVLNDTADEEIIRVQSADTLGKLSGGDFVADLLRMRSESDSMGQEKSAEILKSWVKASHQTTVPALIKSLTDPEYKPQIRSFIADLLGLIEIAPRNKDVVSNAAQALLEAIRSDEAPAAVKGSAAISLKKLANADHVPQLIVPGLIKMALESDVAVQERAADVLKDLPSKAVAASTLLAVVQDKEAELASRKQSAKALAILVEEVPEEQLESVREDLTSVLLSTGLLSIVKDKTDEPEWRQNAAVALAKLIVAVPEEHLTATAAKKLAAIAEDGSNPLVQARASESLGHLIARAPTELLSDFFESMEKQRPLSNRTKTNIVLVLISHLSKADSKDLEALAEKLARFGQAAIRGLSEEYTENLEEDYKKAQFRSRIVNAIGQFRHGDDPKFAIPKLLAVLTDTKQDVSLRIAAAEGLVSLGEVLSSHEQSVVEETAQQLLPVIENTADDSLVRESAANALASLPPAILERLVDELKKLESDKKISEHREVFLVLARICVKEEDGVPDERLLEFLPFIRIAAQKSDLPKEAAAHESELSNKAAESLIRRLIEKPQVLPEKKIQKVLAAHGGKEAVSLLQEKFRTNREPQIVDTLLLIMMEAEFEQVARDALRTLDSRFVTRHLLDKLASSKVEDKLPAQERWKIALVLCDIVNPELPEVQELPAEERQAVVERLEQVSRLEGGTDDKTEIDKLATTIVGLKTQLSGEQFWKRISLLGFGLAAYVGLCLGIWAIIYRRDPLVIFRFNQFLSKYPVLRSVCRPLLFVWVFEYRDGVLDAWVAEHAGTVRKAFGDLPTVQDRSIHVPTPVEFQPVGGRKSTLPELSPESLRDAFSQKSTRLLLLADGGSGKTSLACQIAKWGMSDSATENLGGHCVLPVLVEQELRDKSFRDTILIRLTELVGDEVPPQLFEHLLRRQRLLVIFDRFSEMNDETQKNVKEVLSDTTGLSVGSLLITSRNKKELEACDWTVVEPLFIKGNRLSSFMEGYLAKREKRKLFDDAEFFELCRRLSLMVGEREITALFGKLYAEQLISAKAQRTDAIVSAPDSIPGLMKAHLKGLHKGQSDPSFSIEQVQQASQKVAWVCLRKSFRPGTISQQVALEALNNDAELFVYLVDDRGSQSEDIPTGPSLSKGPDSTRQIGLIQRVGENKDHFRFILDPIAEYLAGLHLVETKNRNDDKQWREFLNDAKEKNPEKTKGFLLAVRDCCLATEVDVPDGVPHELGKLAGLNIQELEQHQREQRIRRNVANLDLPAAEDRVAAAQTLGSIGVEAERAVPVLIRSLRDRDWRVRAASAGALAKITIDTREVVPELGGMLEDEKHGDVLQMAVKALGEFGGDSKDFIPQLCSLLRNSDNNKDVRQEAATALGQIGKAAKEVTPELIKALADDDWDVAERASKALGKIGAEAVKDLIEVLAHDDELVRWRAAEALAAIGPSAKDAVPALVVALEDEDWSVRKSAAIALGRIGPAAMDAVDVLKNIMDDPEQSVAESAVEALQHICPEIRVQMEGADESLGVKTR